MEKEECITLHFSSFFVGKVFFKKNDMLNENEQKEGKVYENWGI